MKFEDYAINITPLPKDEGGGYLVTIPDLPGCIADGETIDDAVAEPAALSTRGRLPILVPSMGMAVLGSVFSDGRFNARRNHSGA